MPGLPEPLQAARYLLARMRPYLATALWALVPVETEACRSPGSGTPTMASDKWWRLYYHPEVVQRHAVEDLARILYHEISHLLRAHARQTEAMGADPLVANIAQDLAINQDLREDGEMNPPGGLLPGHFGLPPGLTWAEYYDRLQRQAREDGDSGSAAGYPRDSQGTGTLGSSPPQQPGDKPGCGMCGSAAHGQRMPWEAEGPGEEGAVPRGRSATESELIRRQVADAIRRAAPGTVPGSWQRWAEEVGRVPVDWRRVLAASIRHGVAGVRGRVDYSWRRPNRRQAVLGPVILPGMFAPVPQVAVVIDTSGSMSKRDLGVAMGALRDLLSTAAAGCGVAVIPCDAAAAQAQRVFRPDQVRLLGGGGTNMGEGLEAALKLRPRPDVIIVMTDGLTPWPDEPPPVPTSILLVGDADVTTPAWARTVVRIQAAKGGERP